MLVAEDVIMKKYMPIVSMLSAACFAATVRVEYSIVVMHRAESASQ